VDADTQADQVVDQVRDGVGGRRRVAAGSEVGVEVDEVLVTVDGQ